MRPGISLFSREDNKIECRKGKGLSVRIHFNYNDVEIMNNGELLHLVDVIEARAEAMLAQVKAIRELDKDGLAALWAASNAMDDWDAYVTPEQAEFLSSLGMSVHKGWIKEVSDAGR